MDHIKYHLNHLQWGAALLLLLLTACGGGAGPDYSNQEGVRVNIFASLGSSPSATNTGLSAQGVPVNSETGETGVTGAELTIFSGETRLFFRGGSVVSEADGEPVTLTPDDSEVALFLPEGGYRFALTAFDEQGNTLAEGQVEQQVGGDSRVSIPLTSLIGSARFTVPETVTANAVFDAFLEVSPPGRADLRVPLGDFTVTYEVQEPSVQLEGSSNVGVRVAAACDLVEVTATVSNDLSDAVSATASVNVSDEACEDAETPVGADLVPPFVSIKTPEAGSTVGRDFTLQGDVNDQQSGVDKVEVYEGTLKLGEADLGGDSMTWSFDASLDKGSYTLIAVAFDQAGNSSRAEVQVTVKEGAGGGDTQTCTNPVNVPDEKLEQAIREALGKQGGELTCEDLASLVELSADGVSNLDGLQYAVNLEILLLNNVPDGSEIKNNVTDLTPLSNLTKLDRLDIRGNGLSSLDGLQELNITQIDAGENDIEDLNPLRELERLVDLNLEANSVSDLSPLSNLKQLRRLDFDDNAISDLGPLQDLPALFLLYLNGNQVSDLTPLVANSSGQFSELTLSRNPLETCPGTEDRADIETLVARGVEVSFDEAENCDGEGGNGGGNREICTNPVSIPDEVLRAEIRDELGLAEDAEITCEDLAGLTVLSFAGDYATTVEIRDLEGLQYATNLENVRIISSAVSDISPLQNISSLTTLELFENDIESVEVEGVFENVSILGLASNNLSDISDFDRIFPNVEILSVGNNLLGDISALENLPALTNLRLENTSISDLSPLRALSDLETLSVDGNSVADLSPLQNLTKLERLTFDNNDVSDLSPISGLANLVLLSALGNQVSDISPLQDLTNLTELNLFENNISDISPLQDLTNLTFLDLSDFEGDGNQISDLSPLQNLTNLMVLDLSSTGVSDISVLQNLTDLTELDLFGNKVNNISPLQNLTGLTSLSFGENGVSDLSPLQNLTRLTVLYLPGNQVSDISVLQNLTNLDDLSLLSNDIGDIGSLVANEGLAEGDSVLLGDNPLDLCPGDEDRADISTLLERGVDVSFDEPETCQ